MAKLWNFTTAFAFLLGRKIFCFTLLFQQFKQNQTPLKSQETQERIASGADRDGDVQAVDSWALVPELIRTKMVPLPPHWDAVFGPLRGDATDEIFVVGQIGQSLDGRVATAGGHSHYINGPAGLAHLHRLRAIVDAVVVGVGTALADDPQLTVRHVAGRNPARVVIDPGARKLAGGCEDDVRARRRPMFGNDSTLCKAAAPGRYRNCGVADIPTAYCAGGYSLRAPRTRIAAHLD